MDYYLRFTGRWPTVSDLAQAKEDEVLKVWQGLGYYGRARNLLAAAKQVMQDHDGNFPGTYTELINLKGVGDYTASAIASICFGRPEAVVDGNVYRVLARFAGIGTPIDSTAGRKQFKAMATELLDREDPGDHNQAVMELGATVCTPRNPGCPRCPLKARCVAFATGGTEGLPVKAGKAKTRDRYFNYLHVAAGGGTYMQQRKGRDIWQGLFEPPLIESTKPLTQAALHRVLRKRLGTGWALRGPQAKPPHVLSHQRIHAVFWRAVPPKGFTPPTGWKEHDHGTMQTLPVSRLVEAWLHTLPEQRRAKAAEQT